MERSSREWLVPLTGLAFVVVLIVSFIVVGEPTGADHPADEIARWYADHKSSAEIGAFLGVVAGALLIFFGGYLRKVLVAAGGEGSMLPALVLVGLSIVAIGGAVDNSILFATAEGAQDIPATSVQTLQAIWDNDFLPMTLGVMVFLWSVGISVIRTGALPNWMGWVAVVLGVVSFAGPASFIAVLGAALWIIVASILLSVRARSAPATA